MIGGYVDDLRERTMREIRKAQKIHGNEATFRAIVRCQPTPAPARYKFTSPGAPWVTRQGFSNLHRKLSLSYRSDDDRSALLKKDWQGYERALVKDGIRALEDLKDQAAELLKCVATRLREDPRRSA